MLASYIPCLDGIRALAFLVVLVSHSGFGRVVPGGFGVTIFFFLSGFLITTLLRREAASTGTISIRGFYARRTLRIFPPMYATLLAVVVLIDAGVLLGPVQWKAIGLSSMYLANFLPWLTASVLPKGLGVLWSLAIEEHFYLIFPWIFLWMLRRKVSEKKAAIFLLIACGACLAWRIYLVDALRVTSDRTYMATDTRFDAILFGCAFALIANPLMREVPNSIQQHLGKLALLAIVAIVASMSYREDAFRETFRYSIQSLALAPVFLFVLQSPQAWQSRWLEQKALRKLGRLSYSMYLIHFCIISKIATFVHNRVSVAVLGFILSALFAQAMFLAIEQPISRWRNERSRRSRKSATRVVEPSVAAT
jgi:peptidoglycan/LPS O-acetylase OafA/YrhL